MSEVDTILDTIVACGASEAALRALLLMGSRALRAPSDHLGDLDIGVFAANFTPYLTDDIWIGQLARPWVYSPDQLYFHDTVVPTRLVIYEGGTKVDYSFWSPESVAQLATERYFDTGYNVLLDKDGMLQQLGPPSFAPTIPPKPSEQEFVRLINEYWFEAYHVAKYLYRGDLWLVKFRDAGSLRVFLLTLMEWYELTKHGWDHDVKWTGKHIPQWLEPEVYDRLGEIFAHFDAEDSWKALFANNTLFRNLAGRTARLLGYHYPADVTENLTVFIRNLYNSRSSGQLRVVRGGGIGSRTSGVSDSLIVYHWGDRDRRKVGHVKHPSVRCRCGIGRRSGGDGSARRDRQGAYPPAITPTRVERAADR